MTSWAERIPNQTPGCHGKWRAAEDRASMTRMELFATQDERNTQAAAIAEFAAATGVYGNELKAPTQKDVQKLREEMGWKP